MIKKIMLIILVISMTLLSGCWDSKDINEKELTTTVVVDKEDDKKVFL